MQSGISAIERLQLEEEGKTKQKIIIIIIIIKVLFVVVSGEKLWLQTRRMLIYLGVVANFAPTTSKY